MIGYALGAQALYDQIEHKVTHKGVGGSLYTTFYACASAFTSHRGKAALEDGTESLLGIYLVHYTEGDLGDARGEHHFTLKNDAPIVARLIPGPILQYSSLTWTDIGVRLCYFQLLRSADVVSDLFLVHDYDTDGVHPLPKSWVLRFLPEEDRALFSG